ncbi:hypothetical protein [Mycobacterium neumannii]|uniref:hypothetical protein n=1 Tax=Mycobacterium neumannii TaxID=2048551 RepID=UPI003AB326D4
MTDLTIVDSERTHDHDTCECCGEPLCETTVMTVIGYDGEPLMHLQLNGPILFDPETREYIVPLAP